MSLLQESRIFRYSLAPVLVVLSTLAAALLHPVVPHLAVYLYLGAVVASGWFGGRIAGLLAAAIAPLVLDYYFLPPFHTLGFGPEAQPYIVPFLLSALAAAWMSSARSQMREEQARSARLATAVEQGAQGVVITGAGGKIRYVNRAFTRLTGYTAAEVIGQNPRMLKSGKHPEEFYAEMWKTIVAGEVWHGELVNRKKDGSLYDEEMTIAPVRDGAGVLVGFVAFKQEVTERRRAQGELAFKTALLEAQSEATLDGILVVDAEARVVFANQRFGAIFEFPGLPGRKAQEGELLAHALKRVAAPEMFLERVRHLYAHPEEQGRDEVRLRDGRVLDRYTLPLKDGSGRYLGRIWYFRDVTESLTAAEELRSSEEKYRSLVANVPDLVWTMDSEGRVVFVSGGDEKTLSGFRPEDCYRGGVAMILGSIHPEDRERAEEAHRALFEKGTPFDEELRIPSVHGGWLWVRSRCLGTYERNGIRYADGVLSDITARRRAEEELKKSEEKYRSLVANIPDVAWTIDSNRTLFMFGDHCEEITGYGAEEWSKDGIGLFRKMIHPEDHPGLVRALANLFSEGRPIDMEVRLRRKEGAWIWVRIQAVTTYERDGMRYADGLLSDITQRKRIEEELRRARDAAEEASRAKSQFLANMSHEIRTPMNGVIGMTGLLLDTQLTPEQQQYAAIVRNSGEALLAVISEILDFSKIEARQLQLEKEPFDLAAVMERAAAVLALKAAEKGVDLTWEVEAGTAQQLLGDSGRLRQVLLNLLGNAVKFTDRGEVALTAARETEDDERVTLRFTVRDTGIGFAQERAQALFEPFVQADGSSTRRHGGTGLGLAISRQLVEMMGGRIGAESAEGAGSTFWFTAIFEKQRERVEAQAGPAALAGARVLVVDGHATNRVLLSRLLRRWGCRGECMGDPETALERLREAAEEKEVFRLALIDMRLQQGDGEQLGRAIRNDARLKETALLLMTPFGQGLERARLEELGFSGQIKKPIAERTLREALLALESGGREAPGARRENAVRGAAVGALHGARVLVAEDNATNQEVAAAILRRLGVRAHLAENGAEAIAALAAADYDLVLMDCEMPVMDGYEATAKIRAGEPGARNARIPIVALTADAVSGDRERCMAVGMNDYVSKPVEPQHLAEVLAQWLPRERPTANAPVLDGEALVRRLMGDRELAGQVVRGFLEDVPRQQSALKKSLAAGDAAEIRRCAHTLKGGSATIGAERLRLVCQAMEAAAASGDVEAAAALLGDLEKQVGLLEETFALHAAI